MNRLPSVLIPSSLLAAAALVTTGCRAPVELPLPEDAPVRMVCPKIVSMHTVDPSSPETVVRAIIKPGMTSEEKALAVWRYCWQHTFHWPAPSDDLRATHEMDVVFDAVKQLNVYGYTYCFAIRSLAESLYEAAGLEGRSAGIAGHVIPEIYFDGKYHYIDNDQRGFTRLPDGAIAELEDCHAISPQLILHPTGPSVPFFPSVTKPVKVPYEQLYIFTGYLLNRDKHYYQHDKYRTTHSMNLALRPGERFTRYWSNTGRWAWRPAVCEAYIADGYGNVFDGPTDPYADLYPQAPRGEDGKPLTYANGFLLYRPDLRAGAKDYADGVAAERYIDSTGPGFAPSRTRRDATADFRVALPYVIVGWPVDPGSKDSAIAGAAVVSGRCLRATDADRVAILVSTDAGTTWTEVWAAAATGEQDFAVDLSKHVEGKYSYMVRFLLRAAARPGDARILSLGLDTACQLNPAVLPAVRPGKNRMTVTFEPGPDVREEVIQYCKESLPTHERLLYDMHGLRVQLPDPKKVGSNGLLGPEAGRSGYVIYEMTAPAGRRIAWAKVGAAFRTSSTVNQDEQFRISYAIDRPRNWKPLYEGDPAPYLTHWCFEADRTIPLTAAASKVFVRYELARSPSRGAEGGKMAEARLTWGCTSSPRTAPPGGVKITNVWKADGVEQTQCGVVSSSGMDYEFDVAAQKVQNVSVAAEWATRPPVSDALHPLMLARPKFERREIRSDEVFEMNRACERLDKTPNAETAINILWNCKSKWTNNAVCAALMVFGGDQSREALRKAIGKRDWAEGCLLVLLMREGPTAELAAFLDNEDASMRRKVAKMLAERGDRAALPALRAALAKEDTKSNRAAEAAALVRIGGKDLATEASKSLADCDARGKVEIAAALAAAGVTKGLEVLNASLDSADRYVRYYAALGLAESKQADAEPGLVRVLSDKSRWVRQAATAGLGRIGTKASVPALEKMAASDPEPFLRAEADWAMREIGKRTK